jgi:threonine/homoserine/homoserine lactone efflux protein
MALMLFLVAFGLGSLVLKNRLLVEGLRWCGAGFLLWLSWKVATSHHSDETEERVHVGFWKAAAFQWVNPKAWLVCVGVVATYFPVGAGSAVARTLVLALLFILAALPSCFLWLAAGASVQRYLHSRRAWRIFNGTMGGLLAGSILLFIL